MDTELRQAYVTCQSIARREAANFYWAFRFLPRIKRWGLSAVYAFCRMADDIVDRDSNPERSHDELQKLLERFDAAISGTPEGPVLTALADTCQRFSIPEQPFHDLISGVLMDVNHQPYQNAAEVEIYCRRVASSVGHMSIAIFGAKHPNSVLYAEELGLALQWTNILRDVGEDADRGRVYIPMEWLDQYHLNRDDVLLKSNHNSWEQIFTKISRTALHHYRTATELLPVQDLKALLVAEIMKSIYLETLRKLQRLHYPVLHRRVSLSTVAKIRIALSVAFRLGVLGLKPIPVAEDSGAVKRLV
jgi:phytoene synthase